MGGKHYAFLGPLSSSTEISPCYGNSGLYEILRYATALNCGDQGTEEGGDTGVHS